MDENKSSGKTIKSIASWLAALQIIPSMIFGFIIMIKLEQAWLGFGVMIVGFVLAFIPYTMLCAFAELVDNSHETVRIQKNTRDLTEKNRQNIDLIVRYLVAMSPSSTDNQSHSSVEEKSADDTVKDETSKTNQSYTVVDERTWQCKACGRKQKAGRSICWSCSSSFSEIVDAQEISELISLRAQGLISDEEYKQAVQKSGTDSSDH